MNKLFKGISILILSIITCNAHASSIVVTGEAAVKLYSILNGSDVQQSNNTRILVLSSGELECQNDIQRCTLFNSSFQITYNANGNLILLVCCPGTGDTV
jgi:hypothetical protein